MIRVVLDTNVIVSALLQPKGNQAALLAAGLSGRLRLCISEPILKEYQAVLLRAKFGFKRRQVNQLLEEIRKRSQLVKPKYQRSESPHGPDNRFLECAEAARADFLITGNRRHFPAVIKHTEIANARQLIEHLQR